MHLVPLHLRSRCTVCLSESRILKVCGFCFYSMDRDVVNDPKGSYVSPLKAVAVIDDARASVSALPERASCETNGNRGRAIVFFNPLRFLMGSLRLRTLLSVWKILPRKVDRAPTAILDSLRRSKISAASAMQYLLHQRARKVRGELIGESMAVHPSLR